MAERMNKNNCGKTNHNHHIPRPKITSFSQTPQFLRVPFILSGYRVDYRLWDCIYSLLDIHNETVNIWSHLLGSVILVGLIHQVIYYIGYLGVLDIFMVCSYLFCCAYGLSASAIFHCFNCVDSTYHRKLRTMDFGGIAANILGSSWPVAYFTFYCHSRTLFVYVILFSIITPLLMIMPFVPFFHKHNHMRTFLYTITAGFPAIAYLHHIWIYGPSSEFIPVMFHPVFIAYLFFGSGMILYVTRIPERFWPGAFDLLGTSHQIWHILVVLGQWILFSGIKQAAIWRYNTPCSSS